MKVLSFELSTNLLSYNKDLSLIKGDIKNIREEIKDENIEE
jgi:hypothetical protein